MESEVESSRWLAVADISACCIDIRQASFGVENNNIRLAPRLKYGLFNYSTGMRASIRCFIITLGIPKIGIKKASSLHQRCIMARVEPRNS